MLHIPHLGGFSRPLSPLSNQTKKPTFLNANSICKTVLGEEQLGESSSANSHLLIAINLEALKYSQMTADDNFVKLQKC